MTEYIRLSASGVRWRAASDFAPLIKTGPFQDLERVLAQATVVKDLRGKRTVEFRCSDATWIIKTYKPGSFWRRLTESRASKELRESRSVMRLGIPAVPVTAIAEWGGASAVIVRKLEGWTSLETALRDTRKNSQDTGSLLARFGQFARQVHDAGIYQDDFNPSNVLIKGTELRLIDFERLGVCRSLTQTQRLRLIAKLIRLPTVGQAGLEPFLDSYLPAQAPREAILARILALADRQAKIDRAKLARNCLRETRNFGAFESNGYVGYFRKSREGVDGLSSREASELSRSSKRYCLIPNDHAFKEWQAANLRGEMPLAVLRKRGGPGGFVVYRAQTDRVSPCGRR